MFGLRQFATLLLAAVATTSAMTCRQQAADKIGSDHALDLVAPANTSFSHVINEQGATYVTPHFEFIDIPAGGVLEVSSLDGSQKVRYTGSRTNFYAEYVRGSAAVLTYYPPTAKKFENDVEVASSVAFKVDRFASGFPSDFGHAIETICGNDDSRPAVCVKASDPVKYQKAQAVARLFIGGSGLCTGWLVGSEGHLITNNHCIGDAATARDVQFELGAECASCSDPTNGQDLGCPGETVATSAQLIHTHVDFDFTLVKLNLKPGVNLAKYGYLQVRESGPVLNEPIYIAQHPGGKPKRLATVLDNGAVGTIQSFNITACVPDQVGYTLDTEGGSSGSPVLSARENVVVALHNCGGCENAGIKINKVVTELRRWGYLPPNALAGISPPPSTTRPSTTPRATTRAPTTTRSTPVTTSSSSSSGCGTCRLCLFATTRECLSTISKSDCVWGSSNGYNTQWCGN